jgi:L-lysine 2,3-aminomutase
MTKGAVEAEVAAAHRVKSEVAHDRVETEAHRMVHKYPSRVPLLLTKSPACALPNTKQKKWEPYHY